LGGVTGEKIEAQQKPSNWSSTTTRIVRAGAKKETTVTPKKTEDVGYSVTIDRGGGKGKSAKSARLV